MAFKKWNVSVYDKELAKLLAEECDISAFTALIASSRGYTDAVELEEFLSDEILISSPYELKDMEKAVEVINTAIENGENIAVYGDYDCDGVTATAVMYSYLKSRNANAFYMLPNRFTDGYGINANAIDVMKKNKVTTVITVDNGISAYDEIEYANKKGIKVVVTDHHLPPEKLPNAAAVVDPHRKDCPSHFKDLSGVGVAFKLVCALEDAPVEEMINVYGDLVAIGTIGDVMPLTYDNRSFVKAGLNKIKTNPNKGVAALMKCASVDVENLNALKVAFSIVPRLNAAGRMKSADIAAGLLIENNDEEIEKKAFETDSLNTERQETEKNILNQALKIINEKKLYNDRVIVVAGEEWHKGIIGIVAAKITEKYSKPGIVISVDGDEAVGSGRSFDGFSLYNCINYAKEYTEKYGGHDLAAGVTLKTENINAFRNKVNEYACSMCIAVPQINIDCKLNPAALSVDLAEDLTVLEPFGNGNPSPIFGIYNLKIQKITPMGENRHLRITFTREDVTFQAVMFNISAEAFPFSVGDITDIAANVELNPYNGKIYLSVKIKNIRPSGLDDQTVINDIDTYSRFVNGEDISDKILCPTREECAVVYKYILNGECLKSKAQNYFINTLGYAKFNLISDALEELGIISQNDGVLSVVNGARADLANSEIFKRIRGENT